MFPLQEAGPWIVCLGTTGMRGIRADVRAGSGPGGGRVCPSTGPLSGQRPLKSDPSSFQEPRFERQKESLSKPRAHGISLFSWDWTFTCG